MSDIDPSILGPTSSLRKKASHPSNRAQISLPRLKKVKRDLLTDLPLDSQECQQEILSVMRKTFHSPTSIRTHEVRHVQAVNNPDLTSKYLERRREWKSCGYPDSFLVDTYAFLPVENQAQVEKICRTGVSCGNQAFSGLGVSHMAVHLNKHADILVPSKQSQGDKICILVKLLKGKVKTVVCKNVGVQLEPTPNYDCHIAKPNVDQTASMPHHLLFYSLQMYVYEYGDLGVEDYPKQILPFAVIHYTLKDPFVVIPKQISNVSRGAAFKAEQHTAPAMQSSNLSGPRNEVWRGKLHVSLVDGGHLNIEVSLFSKFVPLTVSLMSPLKVYKLYPESNAQFTYFAGLTDIADKAEVPWREHYFRSFVMRPRRSNEEHFKALVRHITDRREMPCIGLPNDVYLFLMTNCLLSSQLGLVQRDDNSPVLHCVLMSKYSTIKAEKKKMKQRMGNAYLRHYGKATSWEELFDDSDDDEDDQDPRSNPSLLTDELELEALFEKYKYVQNKLSSLSLADMAANIAPCDCSLIGDSAKHQRDRRNSDIVHMTSGIEASIQSHRQRLKAKEPVVSSHFPPGSRTYPKHSVSRRSRGMSSFSPPRGSSDSDSDNEPGVNGKRSRGKKHYSVLMNSHKTVEEELSEEELTAEQMDDIIFMRKPSTVAKAKSVLLSKSESKQQTPLPPSLLPKSNLMSKPKVIPVEPVTVKETVQEIASPSRDSSNDSPQRSTIKIIPTDPVISSPVVRPPSTPVSPCPPSSHSNSLTQTCEPKPDSSRPPKSILKNKSSVSVSASSIFKTNELSKSSISTSPRSTAAPVKSITIQQQIKFTALTTSNAAVTTSPSVFTAKTCNNSTVERTCSTTNTTAFNNTTLMTRTTTVGAKDSGDGSVQHYSPFAQGFPDPRTVPSGRVPPPFLPSQPIPMEEEEDMGDVDMRIPPPPHHFHRFQHTPSLFIPPTATSTSTSTSFTAQNVRPSHQPMSPSLALGSWLGPQELNQHSNSNPPSFPSSSSPFHNSNTTTTPSLSHQTRSPFSSSSPSSSTKLKLSSSSSSTSLSSPFKPCKPVEDQFDIDPSIASPPSMSPPSPGPLDSPMSPPSPLESPMSPPKSPPPPGMELESPASPPMSNELRSSPIAIPTVRVHQLLPSSLLSSSSPSSPISPSSLSPSPCNSNSNARFSAKVVESSSPIQQVENADDMKDFLNSASGFDSELDSPVEDDSFKMDDDCLQREAENADDMKCFLNAGIGGGGFESESPFDDDR